MEWYWWLLVLGALAVIVFLAVGRGRPPGVRADRSLRRLAEVHGAARCRRAVVVLQGLAERGGQEELVAFWQEAEGLLLEALPDCPPDLKDELARSLEAAHAICEHRETARGLMTLRRSLI